MIVPGGFRTRYYPSWARLLWATLREWLQPATWEGCMRTCWDYQQRRDRQRVCPHPAAAQRRYDQGEYGGWVDCGDCGQQLESW